MFTCARESPHKAHSLETLHSPPREIAEIDPKGVGVLLFIDLAQGCKKKQEDIAIRVHTRPKNEYLFMFAYIKRQSKTEKGGKGGNSETPRVKGALCA